MVAQKVALSGRVDRFGHGTGRKVDGTIDYTVTWLRVPIVGEGQHQEQLVFLRELENGVELLQTIWAVVDRSCAIVDKLEPSAIYRDRGNILTRLVKRVENKERTHH